MTKHIA